MKILCFTDLHGDFKILKKLVKRAKEEDIDLVAVAGDFTQFEDNMRPILKKLNEIGKDILIVPGNHENDETVTAAIVDLKHCKNIHKRALRIRNFIFLGYGEGGFALEDPEFRKVSREWYGEHQKEKLILITHAPPFGTTTDRIDKKHVGNKDIRSFIERIKPKLVICGHLHETAGKQDKIKETIVINPGWDGMVIELD